MTPTTSPAPIPGSVDCGCPGFSRRRLLQGAALAGLAGLSGPMLSTRVAYAAEPYAGDVLVVLSLRGGMDGLSVVPPVGDPAYGQLRPSLAIPASLAIPLNGTFGLHPALAPLKPLYDSSQLAVVHAVGQPSGTRSHFKDQEELERAAPGTTLRTGWLDRVLGTRSAGTVFSAVQLGGTMLPASLAGPAPATAMTSVDDFELYVWDGIRADFTGALHALHDDGSPGAGQALATLGALDTAAAMKTAGYTPANGAGYPDSELGKGLRDLARLIRRGVGLQVACLDYGNWDMHTDLGRPGDANGWMHQQLADVAASLAAFSRDLGGLMAGVTVVTLTEFGRRAEENGSGGLDHGHGQAVLALGGGVRGGQVLGRWPGLGADALDDGDLAGTTDYRDVLSDILVGRTGLTAVGDVFPGFTRSPLGLVTPR